ncbi:MAG: M48 family metallopeptidase [Chloroflexia bacterium]|nr:M48 family metallopeptidase [Chloroflexia bacterium]
MGRRASTQAIAIPGLELQRAKRYSRIRLGLFAVSTGFGVARSIWLADGRRSRRLREAVSQVLPDQRLNRPVYIAAVAGLSWLTSLPLSFLGGHVVESRFGLTKQSAGGWLGDAMKGLGLGLALQVPLTAGAFAIIRRRPGDWWLVISAIAVPLTVLASNLAPVLILPLFNRFEPIADNALADRVRRLADRAGVPIADVFRMDMSRQSEKPNAFFTGLAGSKRIVLGDTLLDRFDPAEIDGVVAHELGHQVHGDMWRFIALGSVTGFASAYMVYRAMPHVIRNTRHRTGINEIGDEAALPLLGVVMSGLGLLAGPLLAAFSRAIERRTDRFALELTENGDAYASAMEKLAALSLADPEPPRPVVLLLASHPPIVERIAAARAFAGRGRHA